MVFQHLHILHLVGLDVLAGQCVLAAEQVGTFDVELVDGLALILNLPRRRDRQARHFGDNVGNAAVLFLHKCSHAVSKRVATSPYFFGFHLHFFQHKGIVLQHNILSLLKVVQRNTPFCIANHAKHQVFSGFGLWQFDGECAVFVGVAKGNGPVVAGSQRYRHAFKGDALVVNHPSAYCLCRGVKTKHH